MSSFLAKTVRAVTGAWFRTVDADTSDVKRVRGVWHALANVLWTASRVGVKSGELGGMPVERFTPQGADESKVILYLHGGAYIMGNCATHRQLVSYLARGCGVTAVLPEYRLAPEHPYPAAVEDALAAYRALVTEGFAPAEIVVAGDSAGGGLGMALLLSLRDAGEPMPAGAVLMSPWLDLTASGESAQSRAVRDPWFKPEDMAVIAAYYCREEELKSPLVSPVFADVHGLPPLFIQVGDDEILLSDSTRLADKVEMAGGQVTIEIWPEMWHVFQAFVHQMPESRRAIRRIAPFVRRRLGITEDSEA